MVSPFFLVALYTAANIVKREQDSLAPMHSVKNNFPVFQHSLDFDGEEKRTETSKYPSSFYRLPRYLLRDKFNHITTTSSNTPFKVIGQITM